MDQPRERYSFYDRPEHANKEVLQRLRAKTLHDVKPGGKRSDSINFSAFNRYTVCILSLAHYPPQFSEMYKNALIDLDMKDDLERSNTINWCRTARCLYPMKTTGDGNCLLHAVSLHLWGVEDADQFLRRLLYLNITTDGEGMYKKRWLANQRQASSSDRLQVRIDTEEYNVEWEAVVRGTEDLQRQGSHGLPYMCLESIHLYTLANILRRPIIVLADRMARNVYGQSLQESEIGGIYLPLESPPATCHKNPLVIGYNLNHFAPLVFEESDFSTNDTMQVVPIVSSELNSLAVLYLLQDEECNAQKLLLEYMNVQEVVYTSKDGPIVLPSVQIKHEPLPREINMMEAYRTDCENVYRNITGTEVKYHGQPFNFEQINRSKVVTQNLEGARHKKQMPNKRIDVVQNERPTVGKVTVVKEKKCLAMGCQMFGSPETGGYCSKCFKRGTVQFYKQEEEARHRPRHRAGQEARSPLNNGYQDISIMGEDCTAGCGFKCSTETYPYCHECYPKYRQPQPVRWTEVEPEVEMSMLPELCITQGCTYRCSSATKPFCHQCYDQQSELQNINPTAPLESLQQTGGLPGNHNLPQTGGLPGNHNLPQTGGLPGNHNLPQTGGLPVLGNYNLPQTGGGPVLGNHNLPQTGGGPVPGNHNLPQIGGGPVPGNHHLVMSPQDEAAMGNMPGAQYVNVISPPTQKYVPMDTPPTQKYVPMDTECQGGDHTGRLTKRCKIPECQEYAIKGNDGMCDNCYNDSMFGNGNGSSPPPPDNELSKLIQQIEDGVCRSPDCNEPAKSGLDRCVTCFLKEGEMPSSKVPPVQGSRSYPEKEGKMAVTPDQEVPFVPSAIGLQTQAQAKYGMMACVTEGCEGMYQKNNEFELCNTCYSKVNGRSDLEMSNPYASCSPVELSEQEVKKLNPVVVSSKQKLKCASPFCEEMIYPPKAYCEECLSALQKARAKKAFEDNKNSATDEKVPCKSEGCKFFSHPDLKGFCVQCSGAQGAVRQPLNSAPLLTSNRLHEQVTHQHHTAPIVMKAGKYSREHCVVPGCQLFGDPSQYNRCSKHYKEATNQQPPTQVHTQVGENVSLRTKTSSPIRKNDRAIENPPIDPFIKKFGKVEGNLKTKILCKNNLSKGCQNFGNARNKGYCNRCYPTVQQMELNQQLAVAGNNRFG